MRTIELLSPAKNADIGIEAIRHGADAVYIGGPGFGARAAAGNSIEDIARLCDYAHLFGARVYVTLNTILYDEELAEVARLVTHLYNIGVDALITQDLALLTLDLPPIALHASTQMDNCTPERAKMLEAAGYSQIVLARELSLGQIRQIHAATSLPLEAFVHGALCVSYSGRCYASEYCFGRSANRGRCAQFCRLAFDLLDGEGRVVEHGRHLLSLRDMNRSQSLEAMMEAGVSSFKIEGRLKDAAYVKNVTAYYRQAIDEVIARHPEDYRRASRGVTTVSFTPQLDRSFNRGFTEYLLHDDRHDSKGRTADLWNFHTPKSLGQRVGRIRRVGRRSFTFDGDVTLNNGDGVVFLSSEGSLDGFRVNRVEGHEVFPLRMPADLHPGMTLYRNEDRLWETALARPTAERRMPLRLTLEETTDGYTLSAVLAEADGCAVCASIHVAMERQVAERPQAENIRRNLSKLGDTSYVAREVEVMTQGERFIPASVLAEMRRTLTARMDETLRQQHLEQRDRRRAASPFDLSGQKLDFTANIANQSARRWLQEHGAVVLQPAFELVQPREAALMTCRHCIRYALGACKMDPAARRNLREPLTLRLADGRTFPLRFDCKHCEMQVLRV